MRKRPKKWSAKGQCPACGAKTGSQHRVTCPYGHLTSTEIKALTEPTQIYGESGFKGPLMYKGRPVVPDINAAHWPTETVYIHHVYQSLAPFSPDSPKRHSCLRSGFWCWKDAIEHPLDALSLLQYRVKRLFIKPTFKGLDTPVDTQEDDVHNTTSRK